MKKIITNAILKFPIGKKLISILGDIRRRNYLKQFSNSEELFTTYYTENIWSDPESRSGPGSTVAYTENLRRELPLLFDQFQIRKVFDAPCGDYNWFKLISRTNGPDYTGGDIVSGIVSSNSANHADKQTRFIKFDITKDQLPDVDLWICRDCLFHLSEDLVIAALRNFASSNIEWLLTSTHPQAMANSDIMTGSFRLLNLEKPPYNLPSPIMSLEDWMQPYPYRHMALWSRQAVLNSINKLSR